MAVIDPLHDAVVIRVVYDGPPMAGKTTSVRALARGVGGTVVVPEEIAGRTLFFDWLDYTGGLFEGRRIRCQVVTVPGQATLASRRRRLLESADVVVFVGDSSVHEQSAAESYLSGLHNVLATIEGPPVGIVYQANKRDCADAVPLPLLRAMLDRVGNRIAIIESVATDGTGIREGFVFAVRLALDRVRELMRTNQLRVMRPEVDNAQDLLTELQRVEGRALQLAAANGLIHTPLREVREPSMAALALEQALRSDTNERTQVARESPWGGAATATDATVATAVVDASGESVPPHIPTIDLPSGMIWPPVSGRLILHRALDASAVLRRRVNGDWIGQANDDWQLHSPAGARFSNLEEGRATLVNWARLHAASAHVISEDRCILLSQDGEAHYRLWQIVRVRPSLRDAFNSSLQEGPKAIAAGIRSLVRTFLEAAERLAGAACWLPLSFKLITTGPGGANYMGCMPDPRRVRAPEPRLSKAALRLLRTQVEYAQSTVQADGAEILGELERIVALEQGQDRDAIVDFARSLVHVRPA